MSDQAPERRKLIEQARLRLRKIGEAGAAGKEYAAEADRRESQDRLFITQWVVKAYCASLVVIVLLLVARAVASGHWDDAVSAAFETFKIGVLPVVTLVLGHYFGRRERM